MNLNFDFLKGSIYVDGLKLELDDGGIPSQPLGRVALEPEEFPENVRQWGFSEKAYVAGHAGSLVLRTLANKLVAACVQFEEINFFNRSILESKIIKRFEEEYKISVSGSRGVIGEIGTFAWGNAYFSYDPRQGDLNLCLNYH